MVKNSPEDSLRVCFDKKKWDNVKCGWVVVKVYASYSSPTAFFENMGKDSAAIWGYEFITPNRPCSVHFDFDGKGVKDGDHSTLRQRLKELRAFLKSEFGIDRVGICVWCGSRETAKGYKNSYHVVIYTLHAANNEVLKHLINQIWPGEPEGGVDKKIYTRNRPFRMPGCSKLELLKNGEVGEDAPLTLITKDPFDPDDVLSPVALPDTDFKMSERSLITVIDSDSTLLNIKVDKKRKHVEKEQTSSKRATRPKFAQPPPPNSDTAMGKTDEVALMLVCTHPQIGSGHYEWLRTLCVILNEAGCHSEAELLAVEYSRIRERYKGVADVESQFRGLQVRGSGGIKVWMATLAMWANENPALIFNTIENSSGLGHVEGVGVNNVWVNKLDQMLRWVDTEGTSWKWLVQCVSYIEPRAKVQMRFWIKQYYTQVEDAEFETIWCIETRSEYYETALKDYILSKLKGLGWRFKDTNASQGFC